MVAACGATLAIFQHTHDIVEIYSRLGMPVLALSALVMATWMTNLMNAYSSGLAINQLLHWPRRRLGLATLIAGVSGSILAAAGIQNHFVSFLQLLTITIPPIAGVLVSDYWIARTYRQTGHPAVNYRGIASWGCGVVAMMMVTHPLRNVLGIVVAAIVYWAATRVYAQARRGAQVKFGDGQKEGRALE
jgi:cytosine permease